MKLRRTGVEGSNRHRVVIVTTHTVARQFAHEECKCLSRVFGKFLRVKTGAKVIQIIFRSGKTAMETKLQRFKGPEC